MDSVRDADELGLKGAINLVTIKDLKRAIPVHCFTPSYLKSLFYLFRDLFIAGTLGSVAWFCIPHLQSLEARCVAWVLYGYLQGLVFTGLWALAHECGHGAFSLSQSLNDSVGLITHSALLVPYFAWKSTHKRHHQHANNLAKDHNYVPQLIERDASNRIIDPKQLERFEELSQDTPIAVLARLMVHQILGLFIYFATNMTASDGSYLRPRSKYPLGNSHFLPTSTLFRPGEAHLILISDIGILIAIFGLYQGSVAYGFGTVALMYGQPYLWCNHWIVATTYLHHTHTELPKYKEDDWTFLKGALSTIDRNRGWVGKHMFHNITAFHVVHHIFSRIPHYHAEEATNAIKPLLGSAYHSTDQGFISSLWESFTKCRWVEADNKGRVLWYKSAQRT